MSDIAARLRREADCSRPPGRIWWNGQHEALLREAASMLDQRAKALEAADELAPNGTVRRRRNPMPEKPEQIGPVVSDDLFDFQTLRLRDEVEKRASSEAAKAAHTFAGWASGQIREAYMRGLKDGFAQGVAARHHANRPATTEATDATE